MKIGYPCLNSGLGCTPNRTFRLSSYSIERVKETVQQNLDCLQKTLDFNLKNGLLFFRIGSGLVPFASHPVFKFDWQNYFKKQFQDIGEYIKKNNFRISMHPDQFVVINALDKDIVKRSIKEIDYHCQVLDLMGLCQTAKVQIHIGGVYGNKPESIKRFIQNYKKLSKRIKKRLVIENDHLKYSLRDCLRIHQQAKIPIVFDVFHHYCLNNGESIKRALLFTSKTWTKKDGLLMVDYSSQKKDALKGSHAESIDMKDFKNFISKSKGINFDIMLEIKDKEKSALKAKKCIF